MMLDWNQYREQRLKTIADLGRLRPQTGRGYRELSDAGTKTARLLHWNVTEHPTAEWTTSTFRTVITPETSHRFVLHDRESIFEATVDRAIASMGRHVLKTPARPPQANAFCERLIGTMRRECLDWLIPIHEGPLRWILREWVIHYNLGRPHASLGSGVPDPLYERNPFVSTGHSRTPSGSGDADSGRAPP